MSIQTSFAVFPAIDVLDGRCVRLQRGDYGSVTAYADQPAEMAELWLRMGASSLHVVDLNGAKSGSVENRQAILAVLDIARQHGAKVQIGGGIRSKEALSFWLQAGADRCIVGSRVVDVAWISDMVVEFGNDKIIAGLDGRNGYMATSGWQTQTDVSLVDLARRLSEVGVRNALVTDIDKDGTMQGPSLATATQIQHSTHLAVLASGGIGNLDDIISVKASGLAGVIVGKALYEGTVDLQDVLEQVRR